MNATTFVVCAALGCALGSAGCERATPTPSGSSATQQAPSQRSAEREAALPVGPPPATLATKLPADAIRASLPELPIVPAPRPRDYVVAAYEFAALHPEVLKYVPCYCGCERSGHEHNESCFIASRDTQGRVLSWDAHGMG